MKLVHKAIEKDQQGTVTLIAEEAEDIWHVYNLIAVGDTVKASTIRKVTTESSTGSTTSNRIRTTLAVAVEDVFFEASGSRLRIKGRNVEENTHVKMGAYHTIDIEPNNRKFSLTKQLWDSVALDRVEEAVDTGRSAELAAVVMQEGLAHVCLVTSSLTLLKSKVEVSVPRKRSNLQGSSSAAQHEKALTKFYEALLSALLRHINFEVVKCILLASPGFTKDQFYAYMMRQATTRSSGSGGGGSGGGGGGGSGGNIIGSSAGGPSSSSSSMRNEGGAGNSGGASANNHQEADIKVLVENKAKFVLCSSSSGFMGALKEVMQDPALQSRLADTKAAEEVRLLDTFQKTLQHDPLRACYGEKHVFMASEAQAVEVLLISDKLFRCKDDVARRKRFVGLVDSVKSFGGDVRVFSSMHMSGEQLEKLTGVCAILRFPMQELDEDEDDDNDDDDDVDVGSGSSGDDGS